jgi:hypothetical protein
MSNKIKLENGKSWNSLLEDKGEAKGAMDTDIQCQQSCFDCRNREWREVLEYLV